MWQFPQWNHQLESSATASPSPKSLHSSAQLSTSSLEFNLKGHDKVLQRARKTRLRAQARHGHHRHPDVQSKFGKAISNYVNMRDQQLQQEEQASKMNRYMFVYHRGSDCIPSLMSLWQRQRRCSYCNDDGRNSFWDGVSAERR